MILQYIHKISKIDFIFFEYIQFRISGYNYLLSIAALKMRMQCLLALLAVSTGFIPRLSKAEDTDDDRGNDHA